MLDYESFIRNWLYRSFIQFPLLLTVSVHRCVCSAPCPFFREILKLQRNFPLTPDRTYLCNCRCCRGDDSGPELDWQSRWWNSTLPGSICIGPELQTHKHSQRADNTLTTNKYRRDVKTFWTVYVHIPPPTEIVLLENSWWVIKERVVVCPIHTHFSLSNTLVTVPVYSMNEQTSQDNSLSYLRLRLHVIRSHRRSISHADFIQLLTLGGVHCINVLGREASVPNRMGLWHCNYILLPCILFTGEGETWFE